MLKPDEPRDNLSLENQTPETPLGKVASYGCLAVGWLIFAAIAMLFVIAATSLWVLFLPLWAAVFLGIPTGLGALALCMIGESTLMEIIPKCIIVLMLAAILIPGFQKAKRNAQRGSGTQATQVQKP